MRIRQIDIDGFGRFAERPFGPMEGPVTVLYGPNEAGKTTLVEFVRAVLFGFRDKRGRPSRSALGPNRYPPLRGGAHGGSLTLVDREGRSCVVSRSVGGSAGRVSVLSEGGEELGDEALGNLLGNQTRATFEQVFAFTLDELQSPDLLSDDNINGQIYSAGMGAISLPKALKTIEDERESLFKNRGSKHRIHGVADQLRHIEERLGEASDNAARYGQLTTELSDLESRRAELDIELQALRSRRDHQQALLGGWDDWIDLCASEDELRELAVIEDFPLEGIAGLELRQERVETARSEYEDAAEQVEQLSGPAKAFIANEAILERETEVARIQSYRGAFDGSLKDLPERRADLENLRSRLVTSLRELGPDWDAQRLRGFDLSVLVREEIGEHGALIRRSEEELREARVALENTEQALRRATEDSERLGRDLESLYGSGLDKEQIRARRRALHMAGARLSDLKHERQSRENLQAQLEGLGASAPVPRRRDGINIPLALLGAIFCAALIVTGVLMGGAALYMGVGGGLAIGVVLVAGSGLLSGSRVHQLGESPLAAPIRNSLQHTDDHIEKLEKALLLAKDELEIGEITDSGLLEANASLDGADRLTDAIAKAQTDMMRAGGEVEACIRGKVEAEKRLVSARGTWNHWLAERGLKDSFRPDTVEGLRGQIELCRTNLDRVQAMEARIAAIEKDIREYSELVFPLAEELGIEVDVGNPRSIAAAADSVPIHFDRAKRDVQGRSNAAEELDRAEISLKKREEEKRAAEDDLADLLTRGVAQSTEEFRARAELFDRRQTLTSGANEARVRLQRLRGSGEAFRALKVELAETNPQAIRASLTDLGERTEELESQREELMTMKGSHESELRMLVGEEETSGLRLERGVLIEQMKSHAREWSKYTIAKGLLEQAREKFELERKPGVVRHAQGFFDQITGGRYQQMSAPLGEQRITVTDSDGTIKEPSELSRGTREQLFLAMRFGLIKELGERTEPMPVIVDEVLVNFDPERARRAAGAFVELSRTNQVLVFTCHPQVRDLFIEAAADAGFARPAVLEVA